MTIDTRDHGNLLLLPGYVFILHCAMTDFTSDFRISMFLMTEENKFRQLIDRCP